MDYSEAQLADGLPSFDATSQGFKDIDHCLHGGQLFQAIGQDYQHLNHHEDFFPADVLDAWYPPAPNVIHKLTSFLAWGAKTSPPPTNGNVINLIGQQYGIDPNTVVVGSGSSELIHRILPKLCGHRGVVIPKPAYGEYEYVAKHLLGLHVYPIFSDEKNFQVDIPSLIEFTQKQHPSAIVLINPNNPSGQIVSYDDMMLLLAEIPASTYLIVDETYSEYNERVSSVLQHCTQYPNLVVFKSLSKSFALSGLRAGFCGMHPTLAYDCQRATAPYIVSTLGQIALFETFRSPDYYTQKIRETKQNREQFAQELASLSPSLRVISSQINSVLLDLRATGITGHELVKTLAAKGIFIRSIDDQGVSCLNRYVRISILHAKQMNHIAQTIGAILATVV